MDLAALRKKIGKTEKKLNDMDRKALLAAPVDVLAMFDHGIVEAKGANGEQKLGTLIDGSVTTDRWKIVAPVWVTGDVTCKGLEIESDVVIEGSLTVSGDVRGRWEPNTLTVLG